MYASIMNKEGVHKMRWCSNLGSMQNLAAFQTKFPNLQMHAKLSYFLTVRII